MNAKPYVLLIDDEPQDGAAARLRALGVDAEWFYPTEVDAAALAEATLLAVDEKLELRGANPPNDAPRLAESLPLIAVPPDGLALAAVLRHLADELTRTRPIGITLRTGALDEITAHIPFAVRQPWLAAERDLEWVTSKSEVGGGEGRPDREIVALARALHSYPTAWPARQVRATGTAWLGLPEATWRARADAHVQQCRPPLDLPSSQVGLSWLRWLAHRALPYPTFVLSPIRAAAALGVTQHSFDRVLDAGTSELSTAIENAVYRGPLADLFDRRFWRAAIQEIAVHAVGEIDADEPRAVGAALADQVPGLEPLDMEEPVVCVDERYGETGEVAERAECERLMPDGWPVYADGAWARTTQLTEAMQDLRAPQLA